MTVLLPRSSGQYINSLSKHVKIKDAGIKKVADLIEKSFRSNKFNIKAWRQHELTPDEPNPQAVDWIFAINAINFSFWSDASRCNIEWGGKSYHGFYSLCAAFKRAQDEGVPICDPNYYTTMSLEQLEYLLRPTRGGPMPLIPLRHQLLKESGSILIQKYGGSFINCIKECGHSAEKLMRLLVDNFPSYRDEAEFEGQRVSFYKRAQIVVADLWACFEGHDLGRFDDIDILTMFADYRVPQVLNYYGVLEYSPELHKMIKDSVPMENGDPLEVEIRGNTIWAVELICEELKRRLANTPDIVVNPSIVDYYLWEHRISKAKEMASTGFHKTRCIYY